MERTISLHSSYGKVVSGLVSAGFSKWDHRVAGAEDGAMFQPTAKNEQISLSMPESADTPQGEALPEINIDSIRERLSELYSEETSETSHDGEGSPHTSMIEEMMQVAETENRMYWESMEEASESDRVIPEEVAEVMSTFHVRPEFEEDVREMAIPQFVRDDGISFFAETGHEVLDREDLREGFSLKDKDTIIDFANVHAELARVDIEKDGDAVPKAFKLQGAESESMKKWFDAKPSESKRRICRDNIVKRISKINAVSDAEIKEYVDRVMANMTEAELTDLEQSPELYAKKKHFFYSKVLI